MPEKQLDKRNRKLTAAASKLNDDAKQSVAFLCSYLDEQRKKKTLEDNDYKEIKKSIKKCTKDLEEKLLSTDPALQKIRKMLAKDLRAVNEKQKENANGKKSNLDDVFDSSRAITKEVDINELKKTAGGQHARIVVPLDGKKVYFGESDTYKPFKEELNKIFKNAGTDYGSSVNFLKDKELKDAVQSFAGRGTALSGIRQNHIAYNVAEVKTSLINSMKSNGINAATCDKLANALDTPDKVMALLDIYNRAGMVASACNQNQQNQFKYGIKQDKRNSAMSEVAELFGVEDTICKSRNMKLVVKEAGQEKYSLKGTAMEEAPGDDIYNVNYNSDYINKYSEQSVENNPKLIRQIADIQILDFICQNYDRHRANIFYKFDENGSLTIKGIDNDSSFLGYNMKFTGSGGTQVGLEQMGVICKETADMIKNTSDEEFKLRLYGYNLNDVEVNIALDKLHEVKHAIEVSEDVYKNEPEGKLKKGYPRVVAEANLGKYSFTKDLAWSKDDKANLFFIVGKDIEGNKKLALKTSSELNMASTRTNLLLDGKNKEAGIQTRINKIIHWYLKGSEKFNNMRKALDKLNKFRAETNGDFYVVDREKNTVTMTEEGKKFQKLLQEVKSTTQIYLDGKVYDKKKDKVDSRAYKRYHIVKDLDSLMEKELKEFNKLEKSVEINQEWRQGKLRVNNKAKAINNQPVNAANNAGAGAVEVDVDEEITNLEDDIGFIQDEDEESIKEYVDKKLKLEIAKGMKEVEGMTVAELEDDAEAFTAFKRGVAASIIKFKKDEESKGGNGLSGKLDPQIDIDYSIDFEDSVNSNIEEIMKHEKFGELINHMKESNKPVAKEGDVAAYLGKKDSKDAFKQKWSDTIGKGYLNVLEGKKPELDFSGKKKAAAKVI